MEYSHPVTQLVLFPHVPISFSFSPPSFPPFLVSSYDSFRWFFCGVCVCRRKEQALLRIDCRPLLQHNASQFNTKKMLWYVAVAAVIEYAAAVKQHPSVVYAINAGGASVVDKTLGIVYESDLDDEHKSSVAGVSAASTMHIDRAPAEYVPLSYRLAYPHTVQFHEM